METRTMARSLRHRQTKGAETDTPDLTFSAPHPYSTIRVTLTVRRSLPVFPNKRTIHELVGMSQRCQLRKYKSSLDEVAPSD